MQTTLHKFHKHPLVKQIVNASVLVPGKSIEYANLSMIGSKFEKGESAKEKYFQNKK